MNFTKENPSIASDSESLNIYDPYIASVAVNLKDNLGNYLSGTIAITGDTTINDNSFVSPKAYILKNITGIEDSYKSQIIITGNPARNGKTAILFKGYDHLEGKIVVYSIKGQKLGEADLEHESEMSFSAKPELLLIEYNGKQEHKVFKVINNSNKFNMQFVLVAAAAQIVSKENKMSTKGASLSDTYTFTFTDPLANIENYTEIFSVTPGNKHTIDQILSWTQKTVKYSSNTNTNTTIKAIRVSDNAVLDERTSATGAFPIKSIAERFDNEAGLQVRYELSAPYTDNAVFTATQFNNGEFKMDTIRLAQYLLNVIGNGSGFEVKDGTKTIVSGNVGTQTSFKLPADQKSLDITVTGAGLVTKTVSADFTKGANSATINLDPAQYHHIATISVLNDIAGKLFKDGWQAYAVRENTTDTAFFSVASQQFSYSFDDNNAVTSVTFGVKETPGFEAAKITFAVDDDETGIITAHGKTFSIVQNVHVKNQYDENAANVSVSGIGTAKTTDANGNASLNENAATDINNVPFATYQRTLTFTRTDIQTLIKSTSTTSGVNSLIDQAIIQNYAHALNGQISSSKTGKTIIDGTKVYVSKAAGDTAWVTTTSGAFEYSWTDANKTLLVHYGVLDKDAAGHGGKDQTATIGTSTSNVLMTLLADVYSYLHPIQIKDQNGNVVANASVSSPGITTFETDAEGRGVVNVAEAETDVHNIPFANYTDALTCTKTGYQSLVHNLISTIGTNLEQLLTMTKDAVVHDFIINVRDIHGDKITDLTQKVEWNGDNSVQYVTPDANGDVHIYKEETGTPSTKIKVSNTSQKWSDAAVFTYEFQNRADTNYAQVQNYATSTFIEVNLTGIPAKLIEYVVPEKVKTPDTYVGTFGDSISTRHTIMLDMMGDRLAGKTTKFIPRPGAEKVLEYQLTYNYTTGVAIDQANIDRVSGERQKVNDIYTLNDGTKLIDIEFHFVTSPTDPLWAQAQARDNYDNFAYTRFENTTPGNGVSTTTTYSQNGKARIKNSLSRYGLGTTTGSIFTEIYQQFTNNADPASGTGGWVYTTTGVSDFGKALARIIYLLNQGTPTQ
ncbi:MAG TPA: hypothetical protein PL123_08465 [Bacteroidales bacterium]|nr:hypothetical protein [Bacteroidales bacterium]